MGALSKTLAIAGDDDMGAVQFSDVVDKAHALDMEAKEQLLSLLKSWLIEERRAELVRGIEESRREYAAGLAKEGSLQDMLDDLNAED